MRLHARQLNVHVIHNVFARPRVCTLRVYHVHVSPRVLTRYEKKIIKNKRDLPCFLPSRKRPREFDSRRTCASHVTPNLSPDPVVSKGSRSIGRSTVLLIDRSRRRAEEDSGYGTRDLRIDNLFVVSKAVHVRLRDGRRALLFSGKHLSFYATGHAQIRRALTYSPYGPTRYQSKQTK